MRRPFLCSVLISLVFSACSSRGPDSPIVSNIENKTLSQARPSAALSQEPITKMDSARTPITTEISGQVTFQKSKIYNRKFLYGADVQHSSLFDRTDGTYTQAHAVGHIPIHFQKVGRELQLLSDQQKFYPSDINHPDQLVSHYKIITETDESITVSEADSSEFLVTLVSASEGRPRDHWTRSLEFKSDGNYLLQESTVTLAGGKLIEVMESVFPAENLKASPQFHKIEIDAEVPPAKTSGIVSRYRLISADPIFRGEKKIAYAQLYDLAEGKMIDWYVTANIPDQFLKAVEHGVEGWNRYFRSYQGIKRDVLKFKGRLPDGIKVGDPRYNIIIWENRNAVSTAYETQASDPLSGKQSHSLIYLPAAWFQIGKTYWKIGQFSETSQTPLPKKTKLENSRFAKRLACTRDLSAEILPRQNQTDIQDQVEKFSFQLLRQTLMHEVGHALGLDHNFKGSLGLDEKNPQSSFSDSLMDYNDYEVERPIFHSSDDADGPLLEYDRQALSALYNQSRDVKTSDPVLPACNDDEADSDDSGQVDPFCLRYDSGKSPYRSALLAKKKMETELPGALAKAGAQYIEEKSLSNAVNLAQAKELMKGLAERLSSVFGFYLVSGKQSLLKSAQANVRALYVYKPNSFLATISESTIRAEAFQGIESAFALRDIPATVGTALDETFHKAMNAISETKFFAALTESERAAAVIELNSISADFSARFSQDRSRGLSALRRILAYSLTRDHEAPLDFYFYNSGNVHVDFEAEFIKLLSENLKDESRPAAERLSLARALASYSGRGQASQLMNDARNQAEQLMTKAVTREQKQFAESLIDAL